MTNTIIFSYQQSISNETLNMPFRELRHKKCFQYMAAILLMLLALPAIAEPHSHTQHHTINNAYVDRLSREIKALSEQQVDGLRSGKGMAMAIPAELNGYPGPLHVLALSSKIGLSTEQIEKTKTLYAQMQETAQAQGKKVIDAERQLDALFSEKKATPENLSSAVSTAALAQGKLREIHLRSHLVMMDILTPEQIIMYNQLRGY